MAKLTKASFAAAKRRLDIKKVTKKNIGRIAKAARSGGKSKSRSSKTKTERKSNPKGGNKRMGKNTQASLFKLIRLGALVAPGLARANDAKSAGLGTMLRAGFLGYAGINLNNDFDSSLLAKAWTPFIVTSLTTHLIPKINGIIRRL